MTDVVDDNFLFESIVKYKCDKGSKATIKALVAYLTEIQGWTSAYISKEDRELLINLGKFLENANNSPA